jgi:NADPH:quinone reductase-like Zn-dependent oxidoreductase
VPVAAVTAWQGLFREGRLKAGQHVLIHAAAGGVGSFAVQFARHCGAHVIATASPKNHDYVRALGAHEVIDYHGVRFEDVVGDLDLVFDLIGGDTQDRSWATLKRGGVLVSSVGPTPVERAAAAGVSGKFVIGAPDAEGRDLREIAALLREGTIRTSVHMVLPLADAARALEMNKAGGVKGKIVLKVRD